MPPFLLFYLLDSEKDEKFPLFSKADLPVRIRIVLPSRGVIGERRSLYRRVKKDITFFLFGPEAFDGVGMQSDAARV